MKTGLLFILLPLSVISQELRITDIPNETSSSFRGLSVVDDSVAWVSGSKGWVGVSGNGAKDWKFARVKGFEELDIRSLHAFDNKRAIIANAGSPAYIFITDDAGDNWKQVYKNDHPDAFIDGVTFGNEKEGLIYGDPINKRMLLLKTRDGGNTWLEVAPEKCPLMQEGEASFAASGTTIRTIGKKRVMIATGGKVSRLWISKNKGESWRSLNTPILQGKSATGIFSFAFADKKHGVIVGGDYTMDTLKTDHIFITDDGGKTWYRPDVPTGGYRSCVEYINRKTLVATGTSGTDISTDDGKNWKIADKESYNVVRKARNGDLVIMAGNKGKVASLKIE